MVVNNFIAGISGSKVPDGWGDRRLQMIRGRDRNQGAPLLGGNIYQVTTESHRVAAVACILRIGGGGGVGSNILGNAIDLSWTLGPFQVAPKVDRGGSNPTCPPHPALDPPIGRCTFEPRTTLFIG